MSKVATQISMILTGAVLLVFFFSGCSNTKFLAEDEVLYAGIKEVEVIPYGNVEKVKAIASEIYWSAYYKPNNSLFLPRRFLPPVKLWNYNYLNTEKEKGLKAWLHNSFSEEPVLIDDLNLEQRVRKLEADLFNMGYFGVKVDYELVYRKQNPKKALVKYIVFLPEPHRYKSIQYGDSTTVFDSQLSAEQSDAPISIGDQYSLNKLASEQLRLTNAIRDSGYYYFKSEYIEFVVDTLAGNKSINLRARVNEPLPDFVHNSYTINTINVTLLNSTIDSLNSIALDSLSYNGINFYYNDLFVSPQVIAKAIYYRSGERYIQTRHLNTRRHLSNYGVFRELNIKYSVSETDSTKLDMSVLLTPLEKISLSAEANVVTKSSGFAGPAAEARLTDENIFGGAEKFSVSLNGGFEWQLSGKNNEDFLGPNSYELGINFGLQIPRIIAPFGLSRLSNAYVPITDINLGFEIQNRVQYYKMNSYNVSYGYQWRTTPYNRHNISIPDLNIVQMIDSTDAFNEVIENNPSVRRSFEEQTILSLRYRYSYDNTPKPEKRFHTIWESGLVLAAPFATFVKTSQDFRLYLNLNRESKLVNRFYFGLGYPVDDQMVMPYVEQFFSGGANSVRGFVARSLGPGGFLGDTLNYFDQTGDIRLEYNLEYRYKLGSKIFGAAFLDFGNIWLINEDEQRPGSQFKLNTFYEQFAIGAGLGIRLDFSFFVLRFDFGYPLRNPGYDKGNQWFFQNSDVKGLKFFFAVGYPF